MSHLCGRAVLCVLGHLAIVCSHCSQAEVLVTSLPLSASPPLQVARWVVVQRCCSGYADASVRWRACRDSFRRACSVALACRLQRLSSAIHVKRCADLWFLLLLAAACCTAHHALIVGCLAEFSRRSLRRGFVVVCWHV